MSRELTESPLEAKTPYVREYTPSLLYPVPRQLGRERLGFQADEVLPFTGADIWNGYELSWLLPSGKPCVAVARFIFPAHAPYLVESKSFKLYLNSFNFSCFADPEEVRQRLKGDLERVTKGDVEVELERIDRALPLAQSPFEGRCLDALPVEVSDYRVAPELLKCLEGADGEVNVEEAFHTHLLKSNCLVTGQPDWGTLTVRYRGKAIDPAGLLKYVISFRDHNGFAEMCVERIFCDLMERCQPDELTVYACYTRRGGLDICPFRTNGTGQLLRLRAW
ncbi:MAG: NADPH-dependent 7-cyano-7-deazaguanine reductase QueF [Chlamydiia bacterium]|nr:NADPH-dependent 7-cyano-7-deazaguanine reductase QueF [Chlamydiia bacterium]